jgi:putative ABC transport system permease protein
MQTFLHDLRSTGRGIRNNWIFSLVVILTLSLGIGANTLIYSIVDGVVLNPFPFPEPDRLVGIGSEWPRLGRELGFLETLSPQEYRDVKEQSQTLEHIVMWDMEYRSLSAGGDRPEVVLSAFWFDDAFPTLAMNPVLGRGFSREELERGDPVAIVSQRYWRTSLGGDPDALGKTLYVEGDPVTLIGIIPAKASLFASDLWTPIGASPKRFSRGRRQMQILARIKPRFSLEDVNAELSAISGRIEQEYGQEFEEYAGWRMRALPWTEVNVRLVKPAALALLGAVGFVLLIVCANVASLLLARSSRRRKEIAVRTALGAGRLRIVRQLLTESVVLAGIGGILGAVTAFVAVRALLAAIPRGLPIAIDVSLNYRVLLFTAAVSVLAGIIFGLVPALQVSRTDVQGVLHAEGSAGTGSASRQRLQRLFVGAEFAVALVLLVVGGLFAHSFVRMQNVDPGFDTSNTLTMRLTLAASRFTREERAAFFPRLVERVNALPGVRVAGAGTQYPPVTFGRRSFSIEGESYASEEHLPNAYFTLVTDGYHEALGIPLLRGRTFTVQDRPESPLVAVINEAAERRYFPAGDAIGRRVNTGGPNDDGPWAEIVGVVRAVHNRGLEQDPQPEFFANIRQIPGGSNQLFLIVRTEGDPYGFLDAVQAEVAALDPNQSVYAVQAIEDVFHTLAAPRRLGTLALTLFAVFAVCLAAAGIYAVVSYGVSERTKEIGLRVALGADPSAVRWLVVRQAMLPVAIGGGVGLVLALLIGRNLSDLLFGLSGTDPATVSVVALLLGSVAVSASYVPAFRASRLAPTVALRNQ